MAFHIQDRPPVPALHAPATARSLLVPRQPALQNVATTTHLFAGGCGDLLGFAAAGYEPVFAANHAQAAIDTVQANFPTVAYQRCDINNLDFRDIPRSRVLVGSPICKEVSPAGRNSTASQQTGGAARTGQWSRTRATAWDLIRAAEVHDYDVVCGENVPDFATRWVPFEPWLNVWDALGYNIDIASVNAAHISGQGNEAAPQHRNRILFAFTKKGLPRLDLQPRPESMCRTCGPVQGVQVWAKRFEQTGARRVGVYGKQYRYACPNVRCDAVVEPVTRPIRDHIDLTLPGRRFRDGRANCRKFTPYRAETRRKVTIGLERFHGEPFIAILRNHCTVQSLDEPIGAITAEGNHHLLVKPSRRLTVDDCEDQMISLRAKARAQRFPDTHVFQGPTAADLTRQVGNAVPVNAASWLAARLQPSLN
ncbi:DNA cytosine methyltransferase [Streptomyces sp. MS2.AVA.5]|uniref:DNA cytosine methyltransferase n=1 Tax=Streptomyces achmelvichensis TaxID=3134111 RepID=A0ACC6Q8U1_9ACTN